MRLAFVDTIKEDGKEYGVENRAQRQDRPAARAAGLVGA